MLTAYLQLELGVPRGVREEVAQALVVHLHRLHVHRVLHFHTPLPLHLLQCAQYTFRGLVRAATVLGMGNSNEREIMFDMN